MSRRNLILSRTFGFFGAYFGAFLGSFLVVSSGFCNTSFAEDEILKDLIKARSTARIVKMINEERRFQKLHMICDAELRASKLPIECFEVVALRSAGKYDKFPVQDQEWLTALCVSRSTASHDFKELARASRTLSLPEKCRRAAESRSFDLRYTFQSDRPAEYFNKLSWGSPPPWRRY